MVGCINHQLQLSATGLITCQCLFVLSRFPLTCKTTVLAALQWCTCFSAQQSCARSCQPCCDSCLHGLARPNRNLKPVLLAVVVVDSNCLDNRTTCIVHLLLNLLAHCNGDLHACLRCESLMHIRVYLHKMPQGTTSSKQTQNRGKLEIMTRLSCTVLDSHLQTCKTQT